MTDNELPSHEHPPPFADATGSAPAKVSRVGEGALLLEAEGELELNTQRLVWGLADEVQRWKGVLEIVAGMTNLLVIYDPFRLESTRLQARLLFEWSRAKPRTRAGKVVEIPVVYGGEMGPDLAALASHAGLSPRETAVRHAETDFVAYALGSSPGFAYLGGLPASLFMARRAVPILSAPAGSVMIGGNQTGVTSAAGPTGWHIIGRATRSVFDADASPPALIAPGDTVRFRIERIDE
ncbi:5-oxoprolinase subunit PxpB [Cupriavidus sp. IK-TO18]|uniref:5-oxoprolinase subunit PxpB n=1 Tax=Cupriavidus sp. IK-TO18 TaxID=2782182 RepID=UPI00189A84A5|nr:5-oxoprolinase subunit PxpB [Cupriavidus sp. IK-TO18]MBF6989133.1 5-oxoprolinase subunit PxpB [Cupriavidus sp. IK-TO18]